MKKFLKALGVLILVVVSVILFSGVVATWGGDEDTAKDGVEEVKKETSKPKKEDGIEFKLGEDVNVGNLTYNVSKVEKTDLLEDGTGYTEQPRDKYFIVTVTITNNKKEAVFVSSEDILVKNADIEYSTSSDGLFTLNQPGSGFENISITSVNPNQSVSSEVLFDIPESVIDDSETVILVRDSGKRAEISLK